MVSNQENNLNNCLNTNITNNITLKINPFGEENLDFLTNEDKLKIVNRCYMGVPELIKKIHNKPENHNIFISNLKNNVMAVLNKKNELEYNDYNEICEQLIEKNLYPKEVQMQIMTQKNCWLPRKSLLPL